MYRPEGFPDHYDVQLPIYFHGIALELERHRLAGAFEAGADAMLEGLKNEATKHFNSLGHLRKGTRGYIVFIPEEE